MERKTTYSERAVIVDALVNALRKRPDDFTFDEFWLADRKSGVKYWIANGQMFLRACTSDRFSRDEFMIGPCCKSPKLFTVASIYAWWYIKKFMKENRNRGRTSIDDLLSKINVSP